jgi:hypothetical protein
MKSKIQKAILIIKGQIKKIEDENFDYDSWKTQCTTLIEFYFGENSGEYKSLHKPTIRYYSGYETQKELTEKRQSEIKTICKVLETATETLEIVGIYKKPKSNILSSISEGWLIFIAGLIISAFAGLFYIGYWCGQQGLFANSPLVPKHKTTQSTNKTYDST